VCAAYRRNKTKKEENETPLRHRNLFVTTFFSSISNGLFLKWKKNWIWVYKHAKTKCTSPTEQFRCTLNKVDMIVAFE